MCSIITKAFRLFCILSVVMLRLHLNMLLFSFIHINLISMAIVFAFTSWKFIYIIEGVRGSLHLQREWKRHSEARDDFWWTKENFSFWIIVIFGYIICSNPCCPFCLWHNTSWIRVYQYLQALWCHRWNEKHNSVARITDKWIINSKTTQIIQLPLFSQYIQ